jgi:6,7-dimethyl-8-ribityllumazine synthase
MPKIIEAKLLAEGKKFALVVSRFNNFITERLLEGALDGLLRSGARDEDIEIVKVPGAFEIPLMAKKNGFNGSISCRYLSGSCHQRCHPAL